VHASGVSSLDLQSPLKFANGDALAVFFQPVSDSVSEEAFLQWIVHDAGRELVGTERLSSSLSVQEDAAAVLVAKRAVAIALASGTDPARQHVVNEVHNLSQLLSPPQFERVALRLFHFYRGPLMGGAGGQYAAEDSALAREHFLNLMPLHAAVLTMCPRLYGFRRHVDAGPLDMPLSTLSLESDVCLVLDTWEHVIVWNGLDSGDRERALAVEFAEALGPARFPAAQVQVVFEDKHGASRLRARLSPEHKAQESGSNANRALMGKLWNLPCDDFVFAAFLKQALG
jgi:hypothetical protein